MFVSQSRRQQISLRYRYRIMLAIAGIKVALSRQLITRLKASPVRSGAK